tara:strand:- start:1465 stop:3066 length:1602 start_codon:yes stop_codon:yes gene_type:complete
MAQETFTLSLDSQGISTSVTINDTSNVPYVDFIGTSSDTSTTWTVPTGVTAISAVTIGGGAGGGAGSGGSSVGGGGGGGGLSWKNSIAVTPGETLYIQAGRYGAGGAAPSDPPGAVDNGETGGNSLIYRNVGGTITYLLSANGGVYGTGSGTGGQGGNGGSTQDSSYGGERGANGSPTTITSANGFTIRGGGGAGTYDSTTQTSSTGGGDGRSLAGGSGIEDTGIPDAQYSERGETYGGGGSGSRSFGWRGGPGAVRIRFDNKEYPNPNISQALFITSGTASWTVPAGVTSISAVAVGGGGGGFGYWDVDANWLRTGTGGNGGDLQWVDDLTVTPGETLSIVVGAAGQSDTSSGGAYGSLGNSSTAGGSSSIARGTTVLLRGKGGNASGGSNGDTNIGDGGATGGAGGYDGGKQHGGQGGGGAAGYTGDGTNGMAGGFNQYNWYYAETPSGGSASGGDGGGGQSSPGAGGGGVGLLGLGDSAAKQSGRGGSGGANASGATGGAYGGGGGGGRTSGDGAQGGVRIIWGTGAAYP